MCVWWWTGLARRRGGSVVCSQDGEALAPPLPRQPAGRHCVAPWAGEPREVRKETRGRCLPRERPWFLQTTWTPCGSVGAARRSPTQGSAPRHAQDWGAAQACEVRSLGGRAGPGPARPPVRLHTGHADPLVCRPGGGLSSQGSCEARRVEVPVEADVAWWPCSWPRTEVGRSGCEHGQRLVPQVGGCPVCGAEGPAAGRQGRHMAFQ